MRSILNTLKAPTLALPLVVAFLATGTASAQVPHDMNYQGRLTDAVGAPLAGPVAFELRIYDVLSGGFPLYAESHLGVALDNDGAFSVLLGGGVPISGSFGAPLFSGINRYLEVVVDAEVLTPRQPLSSVPWALVAEEASSVQGAPSLVSDFLTLQAQVGSPSQGDASVVDQLGSQSNAIGANTAAASTAQATADATNTELTALQAVLPGFLDLSGQDFGGGLNDELQGLDLSHSNLSGANLSNEDLSGANLSSSNLAGAILIDTDLRGANLFGANLSGANLTVADLRGANLDEADLTSSVLEQTIIGNLGPDSPTRMSGVNFSNALVLLNSSGSGCPAPGTCLVANGSNFSGAVQVTLGPGVEAIGTTFSDIACDHNSDFSQSTVSGFFSSAPSCVANGLVANTTFGGPLDGTHRNSSFKNSVWAGGGASNGDLSGSNFSGSSLYIGAAVLDGANLTGAQIGSAATGGSLISADLTNLVAFCPAGSLLPACLGGGQQEFVASGFQALNLSGATLAGVNLSRHNSSQLPSSLSNADLSNAILGDFEAGQGADFSGRVGSLAGALLPTSLAYTNLSGHDLSGRNFANADLREAILAGTNLSGANLTGARLSNIDLAGADLTGAVLADADLTGASLSGATLAGTDFSGATLDGANLTSIENGTLEPTNFSGASLVGTFLGGLFTAADFRNANLTGADLAPVTVPTIDAASLVGANFTGASLANALGLAQADTEQIDFTGANLEGIDLTTLAPNIICPDGTTASTNPSSNCVGHIIAGIEAAVYTTLQPAIAANEIAILGNDSDIASNAAAVVTERDRALAAEGANNSAIASNASDIVTEAAARTAADAVHDSAISSNASDIVTEAAARAAADAAHDTSISTNATAIATETTRAITAEDSNALAINDLIAELSLDVVQVGDPRLSFTGTWTSQAGTWGANRFSSVSRYSSCEGDTDCSAHTITLALDNNAWRTVLVSTLDWHRDHYFDVFISFDGGANYTFHNRIETYRPSYTDPYVSSIRTLVSNLPQGQDVRVRMQATRGRIHFEGFALSHAVLPEDVQNQIAVRSEDGTISGDYVLDGDITIGTASTGSLEIAHDIDASTTGGSGSLSIGNSAGINIGLDGDEIMARNGSSASTLFLNANGGDVSIGNNPSGPASNLDLSGNADIAGAVLMGWERVSAAGSTTVASTCSFGGSTFSCRRGTATASCSGGKVVLGGGCSCETQAFSSGYNQICRGFPASDSSFVCHGYSPSSGASFTAYAICARMGN